MREWRRRPKIRESVSVGIFAELCFVLLDHTATGGGGIVTGNSERLAAGCPLKK